MDIVKHIQQHYDNLGVELRKLSIEQIANLKLAVFGFYFLLPNFEEVIKKYIQIDIDKKKLIVDIKTKNVADYRKAIEKSNAETDEYADDFEEAEPIEVFILEAFADATSDLDDVKSLERLFYGIIDALDCYENFSDNPEYWNSLMEKEIIFQLEILNIIKNQDIFDISIYQKKYINVTFNEL